MNKELNELDIYKRALEKASEEIHIAGLWDYYSTANAIMNAYINIAKEELQDERDNDHSNNNNE